MLLLINNARSRQSHGWCRCATDIHKSVLNALCNSSNLRSDGLFFRDSRLIS